MALDPVSVIAEELGVASRGVHAVVELLLGGATVPFIARYRKEATNGLDEVQIRTIEERHAYLKELEERRAAVLEEIGKQGKLDDALRDRINACRTKAELEDLYLPFKPKRRTRAMIAREKGLDPLAQRIAAQSEEGDPLAEAERFVNAEKGVGTVKEALQGARDIVAESVAETPAVRSWARELYLDESALVVTKAPDVNAPTKFEAYYDFREAVRTLPSHRFLAVRRGEAENVLRSELEVDTARCIAHLGVLAGRRPASPWREQLELAVTDAWKRLVAPSIESEVRVELKLRADRGAVDVFAQNLRALLLAAPFGARTVIGIDPGQRTGCKVAVVDATGRLLDHTLLHLVQGDAAVARSREILLGLVAKHHPAAVAVGNGTHGRETEAFVREVLGASGGVFTVMVSESGASVYSASDVAREEFPDLDLTVRGAISIARRLQDPLAELVKVDPKSIGVGQYQHDVFQALLARKLDEVVESCVNSVGVELNTASAPLLSRVAGIGPTLARRIVSHRETAGAFRSRKQLLDVAGLGPKTFEQCAGFLRVRDGASPLDASAVHPERYPVVESMAKDLGTDVGTLVGNAALAARVQWQKYVSGDLGEFTLRDILQELQKPGRDPRADFEAPKFRDDVRSLNDLKPGMALEGIVTNVTAFGAFVDIGVHQDGLVHVSQLSDRFVRDPAEVVRAGDKIKVRVVEVDLVRKRIALTAKSGPIAAKPAGGAPSQQQQQGPRGGQGGRQQQQAPQAPKQEFKNNPFERLLKR
ncbi:MAG: RNA-binding transcriptional accessory protein [Deltaproteobacteria bacterium]|nr:RNA-binding transcriptional accessory protein [Deltaproteobacteria bacterium]